MRKTRGWLLLVFGAAMLAGPLLQTSARADGKEDRTSAREKRLAVVEKALQEEKAGKTPADAGDLGKRVETIEKKLDEKKAKSANDLRAYWKDGLKFETGDGRFKLQLGGRIMVDSNFFSEDDGLRTAFGDFQDGLEFRRLRLFAKGTIYENAFYKLQLDFAKGTVALKDAYIGVKGLPWVNHLRIGHQKEPFSLEEQTSSKYITFMERALPDSFAPSRNVGVMLHNHVLDDRVTYAVGWFRPTGAYGGGSGDGDYAATARITALPVYMNKGRQPLHLGIAATKRANNDSLRFRAHPENHQVSRLVDTGAFRSNNVQILGLEAALVVGPFSVQSEYTRAEADRRNTAPGLPNNASFSGYYVEASWFLTGESRHYKKKAGAFSRVKPKHNFSIKNGGFGAWQVAARYSHLDLNDGDIQGGKEDNITFGLNWHLNPNTRVMFNYVIADVNRQLSGADRDLDTKSAMVRLQVDF